MIASGTAAIVMLSDTSELCGGVLWSVAVMLKVTFPALVGVPEITPVAPLRVSPSGSVPEPTDQMTVGVPPADVSVAV